MPGNCSSTTASTARRSWTQTVNSSVWSASDLVGRVGETVADVMSPDPVVASADASVEELAGMMLDQMVRRIPIVEGGRVVGIVSASDIIRVFLSLHEAPARPGKEEAPGQRPAVARPRPSQS